jgi:hypothetical protein
MLHFIGFTDDRYHNAVKVFGKPDFVHRKWDRRALDDITVGDIVLFANGDEKNPFSKWSFNDSEFF